MTTATLDQPAVVAEEYAIALGAIDPDPDQPRLEVDDELAASITEHGVVKAIEVRPHPADPDRWLIVDGERRWRGAKKAGLKTIAAKVTLAVEGINLADRMVRQIVHNTGKPLTPVEEALAFKKIIDARRADRLDDKGKVIEKGDPKYGPVALARELGLPKSTVTDRLAAAEIPDFWLKLIVQGPLQPSHIPLLHRFRDVPAKYQARALAKMRDEWAWRSRGGERIYVQDFDSMVREAMRPFIRAVSEVPGYKGPTAKIPDPRAGHFGRNKAVVMAMDPTQWEPIYRKRLAAKRAKTIAGGGAKAKQSTWQKQEAERQARWRREEEDRQRARKRIDAARPKLFAAFQAAVDGATFATLRDLVVAESLPHNTPKAYAAAARKANTSEAVLRAIAMATIAGPLNCQHQATYELPKLAKRWKVDVAAIVKGNEKEQQEAPEPAGDRRQDPGQALDDDEDDDAVEGEE